MWQRFFLSYNSKFKLENKEHFFQCRSPCAYKCFYYAIHFLYLSKHSIKSVYKISRLDNMFLKTREAG